ncbi:hypothetical protein BD414DRAFT_422300 [Trametes punicea]|nr:hypothetical protein BD414DRAFT_422300 [Trametes punicea]
MDTHIEERPAKRFKHQSYPDTLKEVHLPSALKQTKYEPDIGENGSYFHEAVLHWRDLNLAPAFLQFARDVLPLSASMPLLLHNWRDIIALWIGALDRSDDEGLKALLDLFQKLTHDLRTTLAPEYPRVLKRLLQLLPRALSAEALTALLATFSALFKYVLIPSVDSELLRQAWNAFRDVLPQCHPEVQRATAEVWGATLRRLKVTLREDCVLLLAGSSDEGLGDACAWIFVTACKSVSQTLHTATASLIGPLVRYHLSSEAPENSFTLTRRVVTALIHHCKGPEQFAPVSDVVVSLFSETIEDGDEEKICRILDVAGVICSVRQGSRMTHNQLSAMLARYPALPLTDKLHPSLLRFTTSALTAGEMALWTTHGRKVLERSWERPILGIELTGALSDLSWGGWKLLAAPHVSSKTHLLLDSHPAETLELLAVLHKEKRLNDMDIVWKQRFQAWVEKTFASWEHNERNVQLLQHVLELSNLLPSLSNLLVRIVEQTLRAESPRAEYEATYANSAWVIGACLECLFERSVTEWADAVDLATWTMTIVDKWGWSSRALEGLAPLARAR